jgi:hypothetical protein
LPLFQRRDAFEQGRRAGSGCRPEAEDEVHLPEQRGGRPRRLVFGFPTGSSNAQTLAFTLLQTVRLSLRRVAKYGKGKWDVQPGEEEH